MRRDGLNALQHGRIRRAQIGFVDDDDDRRGVLFRRVNDVIFEVIPRARFGQQHDDISAGEGAPRPLDPQPADLRSVVKSARIEEIHRPERQQFHRFFHHVRRRPRRGGNQRHVLPGNQVQKTRFADVCSAK